MVITNTATDTTITGLIQAIESVADPEIPTITIKDLGILGKITQNYSTLIVPITPTYSGCPAVDVICEDIKKAATQFPDYHVIVKTILSPAWTTDRITKKGREALIECGITPPMQSASKDNQLIGFLTCPHCKSHSIEKVTDFSSTACRALFRCLRCKEPFEYFKRLA